MLEALLDWIAPRRCIACDAPGAFPTCPGCGELGASTAPTPIMDVPVRVAGVYGGALANAIRRFKYAPRPDLAKPLASLLAPLAEPFATRTGGAPITWVPVPLHPVRLAERGFNQSALLARYVARAAGGSTEPRALDRVRDTGHQARLGREQRAVNLRDAFVVRRAPRRVGLIDDVVTTGATARSCVEALTGAGVEVSVIVALALAEPDTPDDDAPRTSPPAFGQLTR